MKLIEFYQRIREQYLRLLKRKEYYKAKYKELVSQQPTSGPDMLGLISRTNSQGERTRNGSPVEMVTLNGNAVVGTRRSCEVEPGGV